MKLKLYKKVSLSLVVASLVGVSLVYAQLTPVTEIVVENINVFPDRVRTTGWENVGTLRNQNAGENALYQDFNTINSSYIDTSNVKQVRDFIAEQNETEFEEKEKVENISVVGATSTASSTNDVLDASEGVGTSTASSSLSDVVVDSQSTTSQAFADELLVVSEDDSAEDTIDDGQVSEVLEPTTETEPEPESEPEDDVLLEEPAESTEEVSFFKRVETEFALVFASFANAMPFVVESTTTEILISDAEESEVVSTSTIETTETEVSSEEEVGLVPVTPIVATSTATSTEELSEVASSTEVKIESFEAESVLQEVIETTNTTETTEAIEIVATTSSVEAPVVCEENCGEFLIELSGFGIPVFDDQIALNGVQFRISMAAKQKAKFLDTPHNIKISYSYDGSIWTDGAQYLIEDELSNSLNGGYFLMALPEIADPETLQDLSVRIVYEGDPTELDGIYVDSAWLELFTTSGFGTDGSVLENFDDGFTKEPLVGDELVLPDGKILLFEHTDENNDETLIIKSDETTYNGLTQATTYFNVTNTSGRDENFSVQTYFPQGVGEVTQLESWNKNKPTDVVLPEYRPFVYHCEGGWEVTDKPFNFNPIQLPAGVATTSDIGATSTSDELGDEEVGTVHEVSAVTEDPGEEAEAEALTEDVVEEPNTESVELGDEGVGELEIINELEATSTETNLSVEVVEQTELTVDVVESGEENLELSTTTVSDVIEEAQELFQSSFVTPLTASSSEVDSAEESKAESSEDVVVRYLCPDTKIVRTCDELDGDDTSCRVEQVKVEEYNLTAYKGGWVPTDVSDRDDRERGFIARTREFLGFGPDVKNIPDRFEVRAISKDTYEIEAGETRYFKMDIEFPAFSQGEFWIEAVGETEYGLLDPFWHSEWLYRIPIQIDNTNGTSVMVEQQVFLELDSTGSLSDFWDEVADDGGDIRFVQETERGTFNNADSAVLNWFDFDWSNRITIEIPPNSVTEDLDNFPVYVNLSDFDSTFWSTVKSDGGDIRVTTSDGTFVPIDLVEIDTTAETGELHFSVPTLVSAAANTFYLYYGNASASGFADTDPLGSQTVWNNAGYNAVYHFYDDPTTISNLVTDETGNGYDLSVTSAALATTTGQMGTALDLTAGVGYLATTTWTFEGGDPLITTGLYFQTAASNEALWQWGTAAQPDRLEHRPWYTGASTNGSGLHYFGVTGGATYAFARDITAWHSFGTIGTTSTSDNNYVYHDGILVETVAQTIANPTNNNVNGFQVGRQGGGGSWNGFVDELRIATTTRPETWVEAETKNLQATSTFLLISPSQDPSNAATVSWYSTSWSGRQKISISPALLDQDQFDFPVYVDLGTLGSEFFAGVASDGRDIRVTTGDGVTEVPIEVVDIDTGGETGELHFKTDLLTSTANDFYIYFDNSDAVSYDRADAFGSDNVWTNNFLAVYHFNEDVAGTGNANVYKDATSNQYDGDDENSSDDTSGQLGNGLELGDAAGDRIMLPEDVLNGVTDITATGWYLNTVNTDQAFLSAANASFADEFMLTLDTNAGTANRFLFEHSNGNETTVFDNAATWDDGIWQHFMVTGTDSSDEVDFYRNGVGDTENPDTQVIDALVVDSGGLVIGQDQASVGNYSSGRNYQGQLDELRLANVVRTPDWASTEFLNQNTPEDFYSTSSVESLTVTNFVELDFWMQHFSTTTDEADIWVQVDSVPAGEVGLIYLYYGSPGATSASDELATFSYSTSTDIYYVVDDHGAASVEVQSLIDNNEVSINGGLPVSLDQGESTSFASPDGDAVISVLGPISGTVTGQGTGGSDMIAPISFATTSHAIATARANQRHYVLAPFASTTVSSFTGASGAADITTNAPTGTAITITASNPSGTQGVDGDGVVIEATSPVLVMHRSDTPGDGLVSYPPTTRDIFGINSNFMHLSALASVTDSLASCSAGAGGVVSTTTRGDHNADTSCTASAEGVGSAVRLSGQSSPITAVQQADSDGNETSVYWPQHEFGTRYGMPHGAAYAAIVCSPRFGDVSLEVQDNTGALVSAATCSPGATTPGKAYFGTGDNITFTAGHQVVSTNGVPFYMMYEDASVESTGDENNTAGPVQGRKFGADEFAYVFGPEEIANDAKYEQLSFAWYENIEDQTPTSTYQISEGEFVAEGEGITGAGAVDNGDVLRVRMNLLASNATGTAGSEAFKLQYTTALAGQCSAVAESGWFDVGQQGSTTAAFSGFDNAGVADGTTLSTTTLASSTVLGTYEERNFSDFIPNDIEIGEVAEWDWVIEATNVSVNTNYCFRMVRAKGQALSGGYSSYPELETVGPPNTPTNLVYFDNERANAFDAVLEFTTTDISGDDINYQIQIDDDIDFSSVEVDRNSDDNFLEFENLNTPSDKAPFDSGARIRFTAPSSLSATTTYWWRVRADDPDGSATSSEYSVPFSFTTDGSITVSEWHQTTGDQFGTNALSNLSTSTGAVALSADPGSMTSNGIDFDDATVGNAWGAVAWSATESSGTVLIQVEFNNNGTWQLVPDSVITDNSTGTGTSPINILGMDTDEYNEIRLVANFAGTTVSLEDWTVTWGQRVNTPVLGDPFDNQKTTETLPVFDFISSDPQGDDLEYEISFSQDITFETGTTTFNSTTSPGFANQSTPADLGPFNSGDTITYTTQPGSPFTNGETYWWRVRAKDPDTGNSFSPWSDPDNFTVDTAITVSTWFQTTQEQFEQGILDGVIASTTGSVELTDQIGEFGTVTITNNEWQVVNTTLGYDNMVVVASPEYNVSALTDGRTPRVRNKLTDSFEIKVDDHDGFTGSTVVDYIVMEAGEWVFDDGGSGLALLAGTESDVTEVISQPYGTSDNGQTVTISTSFGTNPVALATVVTDNDSTWVASHLDGGTSNAEWTSGDIRLSLAKSLSGLSHSGGEDIDYVLIDRGTGSNNGATFQTLRVLDDVEDSVSNAGHDFTLSGFSSAPAVTVMHANSEGGGDGSFALKDLSGTNSSSNIFASVLEVGSGANAHGGDETVGILAFEDSSGIITRLDGGSLSGTFVGEDVIFSDGTGPKFANFNATSTTPGSSSIEFQIEYEVSDGVYALIPDGFIPGNSIGTSSVPIDLTAVDINLFGTIRARAILTCGGGGCPTLDEWHVEWSEGVDMSGTVREYDRSTTVTSGTVRAAVNGVLVSGSAVVAGDGTWTLNNVTAFDGDVVTVWVDGAAEADEAVTIFVYDGLGDITGVNLYEQHVAFDADEKGTTTNALLSSYDNSVSGDEDIFFDVDVLNNLTVCATGVCDDANLYIGTGHLYIASTSGSVVSSMHDLVNDGTIELDANTFNVSGSWINNATSSTDTSTVNLTASTTGETISSTESPLTFNNLSFGSGLGTSLFTLSVPLDLSGSLSVNAGTLDRGTSTINLQGSLTTGALGKWTGEATTTFDGSGSVNWGDANATATIQNIGNVVIDGTSKFVTLTNNVGSYDVTIGANDTLSGGGTFTMYVAGDWTNNGSFLANTSNVEFVLDDRTYPPIVPGSADWYSDVNFVDRIPVVVDNDEVVGDLANFPTYVDLSTLGSDFWDSIQSDGDDIRITASDGQTELAYDLVEFDATAETGELHFLADSVSSSATTTFYIYHNNPTASSYAAFDTFGSQAVWSEYEAVYHFYEDPTTIGNSITDETGNGHTLLVEAAALATTSGQLGTAIDLDGLSGLLRSSSFVWNAGDPLTTSGWYFMTAASNEAIWQFGTGQQPEELYFEPWDNGTNRGQYIFGNRSGTTFTFAPRDTLNWNHFMTLGATSTSDSNFVYDGAILRETQSQTIADPENTNANGFQVGRTGGAGSINAAIDELRITKSFRNTDWIQAEESNQNNPTIFYATSSVETYQPDLVLDEATHNITPGGSAFYDITFNDATTSPAFTTPSLVVNNDFVIATGTVSMPTSKTTIGGSFLNSGTFMHNNSEIEFNGSGSEVLTLLGSTFLNQLYDVTFSGSGDWTFTDANATTTNLFEIQDGSVTFPSNSLTIGNTLTTTGAGSFDANGGVVNFTSDVSVNVNANGSAFEDVVFGSVEQFSGWYDAAWQERVAITVASTSVTETQSSFPVYVNLADLDSTFWSAVAGDGGDIRMTSSNGLTEIPVEVVEIDIGLETGELHFLAPSILATADNTFYLYFDNADAVKPAVDSTFGTNAVWVNYEAVYHFSEDPTGGITDVSGNGKDLSPTVGTPSTTPGLLGTALDTTSASVMMTDADWTWTSGEDLVSSGLYFQTAVDTGALWQFGTTCVADTCIAFLPWYDSGTRGFNRFGEISGSDYSFARDNSIWHHFTTIGRATDGAVTEIYEDNILRDSYNQTAVGENPTQTGLQIGRYNTGTFMDIDIDELRFATTAQSALWIDAEYNNLTDPSNFYSLESESYLDVVASFTLTGSVVDVDGDVTVNLANLIAPTNNFRIGGSALNVGGSYDPNNATTTFDSTDTGETIVFGDGAFYNLSFNGVGGGWTIATTTVQNNASLVTGADFTLSDDTTLSVAGIFSNSFSAASTTWDNSTLVLSGGDYTVTDRLDSGDDYATMIVSNDSDLIIWNSTISTSTIRDTSSLYMPDFAGVSGDLRIFGEYERTSGTEYWSYDTDFDGTDLTGGSERAVSVQMGRGASVYLATSTTLEANGIVTATTTVSALSGVYALTVNAGNLDMQFASFQNLGQQGLYLTNGTTVTSLGNVDFAVAGGRSGITVDAATINLQPSTEFSLINFATSTANSIYEPEWLSQVIVTIQSAAVNESLTDYVVYVNLATLGSDFWSNVASDGRDIRVTTSNGVEVPYELVEIDVSAETGELHFLAPSISSSADTSFYIHFNNPAATAYATNDQYGAEAVWINYEAVYHFNEDPATSITDVSGNGRDLFPTLGTAATTTGQLGMAVDTTAGNVVLQNSGWTLTPGEDLVSSGLYFQTAVDTGALWQFGTTCAADTCIAFLPWFDATTRGFNRFGELTGSDYSFARNNAIWHHFTTIGRATDGEVIEIYEDNVLRDTYNQTSSGENPTQTGLQIGRYNTGTFMDIDIDELRFATSTVSANRIDAEYTNFTAPTTFYATSAAETIAYNVSTQGVPTTFWLFSNGSGNLYGEAFDNDDGDPGSIQWDDSNFAISISGVVYADDGVTPQTYPVCNGSTEVVTVVLDGTTTFTASCDPVDGSYEVTGIVYTGEPQITTYINSNATETQTNVGIFDEVTGTGTIASSLMNVSRPNVVDDSVLVLIAGKDDDINFGAPPAGWVEVDVLGNTTGDDITTGIWYKVVSDAGTEPATYDFAVADNEGFSYWMGALVNVDTVTPIDVVSSWSKLQNEKLPAAPDLTTVTNGALVLSSWYVFADDNVQLPVYEWDPRATSVVGSDPNPGNNLSVSSRLMETAGATGDAILFGVTENRESHVGQFAFRPATSPTATSSMVAVTVTKTPLGSSGSPFEVVTLRDQSVNFGTVAALSDFTIDRPAVEDGDVLVAIIGRDDDSTVTTAAGWTLAADLSSAVGSRMYTSLWYKVVTDAGSEPASYLFTNNENGTEIYDAWVGSFSGVDVDNVFDLTPSWSNVQNTSSPSASSVVTVTNGAFALATWYVIADAGLDMPGSPWTTLAQDIEQTDRILSVSGQSMTTAGATGVATLTGGSTDDVNVGQFVLRPAPISVASSVTDMDLYQGRVIVRHEDISPLSIADMVIFDNDNESDLPFTASTSTSPDSLVVQSDSGLFVWNEKTFVPNGELTLTGSGSGSAVDGSLRIGDSAVFTASGTETHIIGGSFVVNTGSVFNAASSTFDFVATSTGKTVSGSSTITFNELQFTGVSGGWDVTTDIIVNTGADLTLATGTLSGTGDITIETGSFSGNGLVSMTGGTTLIKRDNTLGGPQGWTFNNLTLGDALNGDITTPASTATTTILGTLTIASAHFLDAGSSVWDLAGTGTVFNESGNFLEDTSVVRYSGDGGVIERTAYYDLVIDTDSGTSSASAPTVGLQVFNDLTVGVIGTSTLDIDTTDPLLAVGGDVLIGVRGTILASDSNEFDANGGWTNDGIFTANGGLVNFKQLSGSSVIQAGDSSFADVDLSGAATFIFTEHATATGYFELSSTAGGIVVDPNQTLAVGGEFTNDLGGINTTWTDATLSLFSGTGYEISDKNTSDTYGTILVSSSTHPRFWNSSAATTTVNEGSSLYSMDHLDIAGDLYIFGDYLNNTFSDTWSYDNDFDGAALGGGARQANVYIEAAGGATYTGGSLTVLGSSTASTTIQNQGSGNYDLLVGGSTVSSFSYFTVRDTSSDGLTFSGAPTVSDISFGDFLVEIGSGSGITVGGTVINANQAKNFNANRFATSSAIDGINVTATGTSVSSWRFPNAGGNLAGELEDNDPGGDPGYVVWDDSAAILTISGTVYSDEGISVSTVCDGVTNNIFLRVAGLTTASTTCNGDGLGGGTGAYTIPNIGFGANDTLTVYINDETENAVNVTVDPISSIGDMDLYENRVIVRHEGVSPITIADMEVWDSDDDSDILFDADVSGSHTMTLPADTKLIVWNNKEFEPEGSVTLSGGGAGADFDGTIEMLANATYTTNAGEDHNIGGSLLTGAGAIYDASTATTTFTTTGAARTIDVNDDDFHNVRFTGSGSWTIADTIFTAGGDVAITAGTVTLPAATSTISGSFENTGGNFESSDGLIVFDSVDAGEQITAGGSDFAEIRFTGPGSWTITDTNATTTDTLTINDGSVTLPSGVLAVNGSFLGVGGNFANNGGTLRLLATSTGAITASGSDFGSVTFAASGPYTMTDNSLALVGDLTVASGTVTFASGTLSIGGSLDATGGTFENATGTILFNSADAGETINPGASSFYNVVFANALGGWTVSANSTTTNNFVLTTASDFTLGSGNILHVGGVFDNSVGGAATTWTGSTIILDSATEYEISPKTIGTELYATLVVGENMDVSTWNSSSTVLTVATSSSFYSQDHNGTNGSLFIFGDYHIGTTTEYWSYATDFDGVALGGSSRAVAVTIFGSASSSVSVDGGTLNIIGDPSGTTTIASNADTYSLDVSSGTFNASRYQFDDLDINGLTFTGTPTVTGLDNGIFNQALNSASLITLASTTLDANANLAISETVFTDGGFTGGVNVNLDATTTNAWTFADGSGDLYGESFDIDGTDDCSSIRWDDSQCLLTEQTHYRWRNDDGGEGAPDSDWFDTDWAARASVRIENVDSTTYSDLPVLTTVTYDADMQADFEDLRFTDTDGTTEVPYWIERFTSSVSADVWVQVPSLTAEDVTILYMYYDNVSATTTSSSTLVFDTVDDFEDDDITEYSGETADFQTGSTFAFGGGFGLEPVDPSDFSDGGMARFDQASTAQGQIIRYRQYIDTTLGGSDEACTLFGVQSPASNQENYAVCLELFSTDRMSLVKDVVRNDTVPGVTLLASTTVDYATAGTGWYEVEIDWQSGGLMEVELYDPAGTLIATTSVTDTTYSEGHYGFTFWTFNGGWDSFTARPRTDSRPSVFFGAEQVDGGATWAGAQDTPTGGFNVGDVARLRLAVENSGLDITNQQFQLEFASKGVSPSCESVSGASYAAVPTAASCSGDAICMLASAEVSDNDLTTDHLSGIASNFTTGRIVTNNSNQTVNLDVDQGEFTELEYALNITASATDDAYCFRTTNAGTALDSYAKIAELTLAFDPSFGPITLNDGLDIDIAIGTTTRIYATGTVTDFNGFADLQTATATIYRSGVGPSCTEDPNNCYVSAGSPQCTFSDCAGVSCTLSCYADIFYHAEPTDFGTFAGQEWLAFMEVEDATGGFDFASAIGVELGTMRALDVDNSINYGTVGVNSDTGAINVPTTIVNLGNEAIDVDITGSDLTDGAASAIPASQQLLATTTFTYDSCTNCAALSATGTTFEVDLAKPIVDTPFVEDQIFWGIAIPFGTASAAHSGNNVFTAISD